jgi:hypothetical protein
MKRQALTLISLLRLLLIVGSAIAQTTQVHANIPCNVTAGDKTPPAGAYDIATPSSNDKMLLLQARDGNSSTIVFSHSVETHNGAGTTKLFSIGAAPSTSWPEIRTQRDIFARRH